jgi:hypothetical protein
VGTSNQKGCILGTIVIGAFWANREEVLAGTGYGILATCVCSLYVFMSPYPRDECAPCMSLVRSWRKVPVAWSYTTTANWACILATAQVFMQSVRVRAGQERVSCWTECVVGACVTAKIGSNMLGQWSTKKFENWVEHVGAVIDKK